MAAYKIKMLKVRGEEREREKGEEITWRVVVGLDGRT